MAIATLATWLLTVSLGVYMLRTYIARGGPRMQRARGDGLPPLVIFGHASLAITGLALWISYVVTGLAALAWTAAGLLMPVVGLGAAMVTIWTPYPTPGPDRAGLPGRAAATGGVFAEPAEDALAGSLTDEELSRALTDDSLAGRLADEVLAHVGSGPSEGDRKPMTHLTPLVPAGHGVAALTTVLLATVTAVSTR